jgi:hypothetical protein
MFNDADGERREHRGRPVPVDEAMRFKVNRKQQ